MNPNSYNFDSPGFDQPQPPQFPVIHPPPQEMSIQEIEDLKQQYLYEMKRLINSEYRDEIKICELKQNFNVTPSLSTKEPHNSLSVGDEHLDTIPATESDEFIKSSVENLIPIPSESEGIPDNMCDVPFHDNSPPLDASPPDSELVSSEVMEIVIPKFDIESDLKEIEFLLYQGKDYSLKDSIDQMDLPNLEDNFVDPIPEMFTDEHTPDYSSPLIFDVYDDDFLEVESDADNVCDDPFDSKGEKIKESKLLIDELDLPCDFLTPSQYDSFNSQDFSKVDDLPSTNNEDKVFNPGILIHEKTVKIITRVVLDKKLAKYYASLVFEDFDPPFFEPLFFKDVPKSKMLLLFSSKNEKKVFKPGIYTSEKVHSCFLPKLSHPCYHVFKVNQIFISLMKIFLVQCGKNTPILDVPLFHFYPP
nr:hypothetical protein [Tanacetum cinerariifolium]